jgi:hypothetical protein
MRQEYIEEGYIDQMHRQNFFDKVIAAGIEIESVSIKKKEFNEHYHKFNILIDKLVCANEISLFEIAIFLYQDYFDDMKNVLNCFDENNQWALQEESNIRYHKGSLKNVLDNFLF